MSSLLLQHTSSSLAIHAKLTLEQFRSLPFVLWENGSGTLQVLESALSEHKIKLSQLNILIQLGSTESIKLFLANSDTLSVVSFFQSTDRRNHLRYAVCQQPA